MPVVKLDTGFNIEVEFAIAPFYKRFLAWLIDLAVILIYLIGGSKAMNEAFGSNWGDKLFLGLFFAAPAMLYYLLCELLMNGQTIGKKVLSIRVIAADGGHPSLSQYLIRWVFRMIDFPAVYLVFALIFGLLPWWYSVFIFGGLMAVLLTPNSQRIGDLAAGTIVISTRSDTSWEDTVFTELEDNYKPRFPQVMQLSDKDINTLKSIIATVRKKGDYDLSMRIGDRIKSKLQIESDQDSLDFLETLLKDYNYYSGK